MNKAYAIMVAELAIIVFLGFYSFQYNSAASNSSNTSNNPQASFFKEPPSLTTEINDMASLINDLNNLDCKIFYLKTSNGWEGTMQPPQPINYTDFRRIAYNTGIVFIQPSIPMQSTVYVYSEIDGIVVETLFAFY